MLKLLKFISYYKLKMLKQRIEFLLDSPLVTKQDGVKRETLKQILLTLKKDL